MLKIALDATYSVGHNLTGVGIYSREIAAGLCRAHPAVRFLYTYRSHRFLRSFRTPLPANARRRLLLPVLPERASLFHGLNQRLDIVPSRRTVCTFHDLFTMTAEYSEPEFRRRFTAQARTAAERADLIIAVSEFTAAQITDLLKVEPSRIRVVHHGIELGRASARVAREPLILFVGAIQRRKNVARLVDAFLAAPAGWKLMLAGSEGFAADEARRTVEASPRRADIVLPGYVSESELEALYSRASIFAFPSLDEGFGMPVLEAMSRGVPVITSRTSALPEVAGKAALLVDPYDTESIAEAIRMLAQDEGLRERLVEEGYKHCARFTWKRAAEKTWAVYQELL